MAVLTRSENTACVAVVRMMGCLGEQCDVEPWCTRV